eukprot:1044059-Prymnesium_polylepis.1
MGPLRTTPHNAKRCDCAGCPAGWRLVLTAQLTHTSQQRALRVRRSWERKVKLKHTTCAVWVRALSSRTSACVTGRRNVCVALFECAITEISGRIM